MMIIITVMRNRRLGIRVGGWGDGGGGVRSIKERKKRRYGKYTEKEISQNLTVGKDSPMI